MPVTTRQLGKELKGALHHMWWYVRLLRAYSNNHDATACGMQYHKFIFERVIEAFVHDLIIGICAIIDVKNARGATFTTWLKQLVSEETDSDIKESLKVIMTEYSDFCSSREYEGIKARRDKILAHIDQDRHIVSQMPGRKYRDLFGSVEKLMNIYDKIATLGRASTTQWLGEPDRALYYTVSDNIDMSPEDLMSDFMLALETAHHDDTWHDLINRQSPTPH